MGNHGGSLCRKVSWSEFCLEFEKPYPTIIVKNIISQEFYVRPRWSNWDQISHLATYYRKLDKTDQQQFSQTGP